MVTTGTTRPARFLYSVVVVWTLRLANAVLHAPWGQRAACTVPGATNREP